MKKIKKTKQFQIRSCEEDWQTWKRFAYTKMAISLSEFIRKAVNEYIEAHGLLSNPIENEYDNYNLIDKIKKKGGIYDC